VGLIQREIEKRGIPTVGISNVRGYSEKVRAPRTIHLKWPFGHALGEPGKIVQQLTVLTLALESLEKIEVPGEIIDVPWRWKRERYQTPVWLESQRSSSRQLS